MVPLILCFSSVNACCGQDTKDLGLSAEIKDLLEVIEDFEKCFLGFSVLMDYAGTGNRANWSTLAPEFDVASRIAISTEKNGLFVNSFVEDIKHHTRGETVITKDKDLFRVALSKGRNVTSVSYEKKTGFDFFAEDPHAAVIFGVSSADSRRFSSILRDKSFKFSLTNETQGEVALTVLSGTSNTLGVYRFWFEKTPKMHLVRIEVEKNASHLVKDFGMRTRALSSPLVPESDFLEKMPKQDQAAYIKGLKNIPPESSRQITYSFGQFKTFQDCYQPHEIKVETVSKGKGTKEFFLGRAYRVTDLKPFTPKDASKGWFSHLRVPNETPASVQGSEGLSWVYRDGDVVRFIDDESIERMDGVRFRKLSNSRWYYIGLVLGLIFFCYLLYRYSFGS